jgi:hypothetical protein
LNRHWTSGTQGFEQWKEEFCYNDDDKLVPFAFLGSFVVVFCGALWILAPGAKEATTFFGATAMFPCCRVIFGDIL